MNFLPQSKSQITHFQKEYVPLLKRLLKWNILFRVNRVKEVEVFPGSSMLVNGEIPASSLLLIGPSGVGKTIFCKHFLFNGLLAKEPCIYISTSEVPEEIEYSMNSFGLNIKPYEEKNMIRIIDGCSWKSGKESSSEYAVPAQQNYLTAVK